jgi:hypothetical protein
MPQGDAPRRRRGRPGSSVPRGIAMARAHDEGITLLSEPPTDDRCFTIVQPPPADHPRVTANPMEGVMTDHVLTGEVSNSKVAAVLDSEAAARQAADTIRRTLHLRDSQVRVVAPHDSRPGRQLEPESKGIFWTMLRAHLWLGILGALIGVGLFWLMFVLRVPFVVNSAAYAAGALIFFCTVAGLMFGGLVTLRPDHDLYILKVKDALEHGRYAVVVHATSHAQRTEAAELLRRASGEVITTL